MSRTARIERSTSESSVLVELDLDGSGRTQIDTTVPFYDHMLTALGKHSLMDLTVRASGDTHIDVHHTVEDTAIVLGQAFRQALGDKSGIRRFADATVPLDEALAHAVVDVSGRPTASTRGTGRPGVPPHRRHFTGSLTRHVLESFAFHAQIACTCACSPAGTRTTSWRRSSRRWPARCATPSNPTARRRHPLHQGCAVTSVVVLDYGFGNVRSAVRALERVGASVELTSDRKGGPRGRRPPRPRRRCVRGRQRRAQGHRR